MQNSSFKPSRNIFKVNWQFENNPFDLELLSPDTFDSKLEVCVKEDQAFDENIDENIENLNPWSVQSIFDLMYFNCPSCHFKHNSKQEFINHAYEFHPNAIPLLNNILDGSLDDVNIPWAVKGEFFLEINSAQNIWQKCQ